jgi:transcriptional regulator with XRE-family HTH domain
VSGRAATSFDEHIGRKLRERRTAAKISQTALGAAIGVSFQQIQKFEAGRNRITVGQLWLLCRFLKIPIASLFEGASVNMFEQRESTKAGRHSSKSGLKAKK